MELLAATLQQTFVELLEVVQFRHRHQEVPPRVAHQAFDVPLAGAEK